VRATPLLAVLGSFLCAGAVTLATAGAPSDAAFGRGLVELLIVAVPITTGVYALQTGANARFGILLVSIGFLWSLTALAQMPDSVPHTVGRLATWLVFPGVFYLLLAYPDGRIARGLDRVVFGGMLAVLVLLFFGTAPLVEAFPPKTLWATCSTDCPPNALFAVDSQPAFLDELILIREWLVQVLWVGMFVSMYRRRRAASPLKRRSMTPVFVAGALLGLTHIAHITYRQLGGPTDTVVAISSAWTLSIVAVCAMFLVGLVRRRTVLAGSLTRLGAVLRLGGSPERAREALAEALGDDSVELLLREPDPRGWRDSRGYAVVWPVEPAPGRAVTPLSAGDQETDIALVHDAALRDDEELLDGVAGMLLSVWRHERILAELARAMGDLATSRRRIAEAAELERARIERDLHDGAQQRLIALSMRLALAEELLHQDPATAQAAIHDLGDDVAVALEEIRSLAQGIYPALLADRGLVDALRSAARRSPVPVTVDAVGVTRHRPEIESAVYYTCLEALQNAAKHGLGATCARIVLREDGELTFDVCDDGAGFDPAMVRSGAGTRNMRDRVESLGGTLEVRSSPGAGTTVHGAVPLRRRHGAGAALA
jgi:signal transduction histidine kinase